LESLNVIVRRLVDNVTEAKGNYREFLEREIRFNNLLEFSNEEVIRLIHLNYRLILFKEYVGVSLLNDFASNALATLINDNYQIILNYIFEDSNIPNRLMTHLTESPEVRKNALRFLSEIGSASVGSLSKIKTDFFNSLIEKGILKYFNELLRMKGATEEEKVDLMSEGDNVKQVQVWCANILMHMLLSLPYKVRSMLTSERSKEMGYRILLELLDILFNSQMDSPKFEISDFFKYLLSPEINYYETSIIDTFYSKCMNHLTNFTFNKSLQLYTKPQILSLQITIELLIYSAHTHYYVIRDHIIQTQILKNLYRLYEHPLKSIRLEGIRFLKALLRSGDEMMLQYIIENDLLRLVINLVSKSKGSSMITTAVLELFEFIRGSKILVYYLFERYEEFLRVSLLSRSMTFRMIRQSYEKYKKEEYYEELNMDEM